jgi:hypothetical protein
MSIDELEARLLQIPPTTPVNRARRAVIIREILRLAREQA